MRLFKNVSHCSFPLLLLLTYESILSVYVTVIKYSPKIVVAG
jgi:hypothetical protein